MADCTNHSQVLTELLGMAAGGDHDAQQRLLAVYMPLIYGAVAGRLYRIDRMRRWGDSLEDRVHAAALEVLKDLPRQQARGRGGFAAWVNGIANTILLSSNRYHYAKKRLGASPGDAERGGAPKHSAVQSWPDSTSELVGLKAQLPALKPSHRAAVLMHRAGYSDEEAAEVLQCSIESFTKILARSHSKLEGLRW